MTGRKEKDRLFARPLSCVKAFEFDDEVTRVFDDMIHRSVPGYDLMLRLIALYSDIFVTRGSRVYDLGCSTGTLSRVVEQQTRDAGIEIRAIDNSSAMIRQCQQLYPQSAIQWQCLDIQEVDIDEASMVILNLTLQFIDQQRRQALMDRVFQGLNAGGALVLTEKLVFEQADKQRAMTELYQGFKKIQGYSDLEISQKRTALENVLIADTRETHLRRLRQAGFSEIHDCFHCFNFASFLAIKS